MRSMIPADAGNVAATSPAVILQAIAQLLESAQQSTAPVSRCVSETSEALASSAKKTLGEYCAMLCCDVVC